MMFLLPLGFLALTGLLALLVIYLVKPSYQNKVIPSSYIWRESLKYRRKQTPVSTLRNILIVICQVLIILLATFIITMPFLPLDAKESNEKIVIIDASADMRAADAGVTRFDRAVAQTKTLAEDSLRKGEKFTVILAGLQADYVAVQETSADKINQSLDALLGGAVCSYGTGDIAGAMQLANNLYRNNALAEIYLYTAAKYSNTGDVNVIDVASENDWNAAVLDLKTDMVENYCKFTAEVAVYGADKYINVYFQAEGVNDEKKIVRETKRINCSGNAVQSVVFADLGIYAYDSVQIRVEADDGTEDSFSYDNTYILYGGRKDVIKIQYASSLPNSFINSALLVIQSLCQDRFDIQITQPSSSSNFEVRGFDFYVFEHTMPSVMPSDGVILLVNPDTVPPNLDIELTAARQGNFKLDGGATHPITEYIDASAITATYYKGITADSSYDALLYCEGEKVFVVKDTPERKVAVLTLNLNYSNLPLLYDFPVLMNNLFDYFIPSTVEQTVFDVNQQIELDARGNDLQIEGSGSLQTIGNPPAAVALSSPGSYTVTQTLLSNKKQETQIFVKIPATESDFVSTEDTIPGLFSMEKKERTYRDLLIYLAAALFVVMVAERILYSREKI